MADPHQAGVSSSIYVLPEADTAHIRNAHRDVAYATDSPFQALDLYLPDSPPPVGGYPLVVFVHGGAWKMCDKRDVQMNGPLQILPHGYALASINYRLSGEARFPAQIHDVKAALRWLRANSKAYGLNAERVAIWGDSAGAHLASLAGTSHDIAELEDLSQGCPEQSSAVRAVVSWFGPTQFAWMDVYFGQTGAGVADHSDADSPESQLLGAGVRDVPDAVRRANPETWLRPQCPPFLLQHGLQDAIVPFQHSVVFAHRIDEVAGPGRARLDILPTAGHGGPEFETAENLQRVMAFLAQHLGEPR
jgi:acetyl esterase/lipase